MKIKKTYHLSESQPNHEEYYTKIPSKYHYIVCKHMLLIFTCFPHLLHTCFIFLITPPLPPILHQHQHPPPPPPFNSTIPHPHFLQADRRCKFIIALTGFLYLHSETKGKSAIGTKLINFWDTY